MGLYVNGESVEAVDGAYLTSTGSFFGEAFRVGTVDGSYSGLVMMDEVRLWERPLSPEEVAIQATPRGDGSACPPLTLPWEPGPLCEPPDVVPPVEVNGEVRVITDDLVAVVSDPTDWLLERMNEDCGSYLTAMEANSDGLHDW